MWKRTAWVGIAALVCLVAWQPSAECSEAGLRIGVIRIQDVFERSRFSQEQREHITRSFRTLEDEIRVLEDQLQQEREALSRMGMLDPDQEEYRLLMLRVEVANVRLQGALRRFEQHRRRTMTQYWKSLYDDFRAAVDAIAQQRQYDLILTAPSRELGDDLVKEGSPEAVMNKILLSNVQYISQRMDITDVVIQTMDNIYARRRGGSN